MTVQTSAGFEFHERGNQFSKRGFAQFWSATLLRLREKWRNLRIVTTACLYKQTNPFSCFKNLSLKHTDKDQGVYRLDFCLKLRSLRKMSIIKAIRKTHVEISFRWLPISSDQLSSLCCETDSTLCHFTHNFCCSCCTLFFSQSSSELLIYESWSVIYHIIDHVNWWQFTDISNVVSTCLQHITAWKANRR